MNEYHKQILITLIRDNKKRIDKLTKILETEESPNMADLFQYELDLTMKTIMRKKGFETSNDKIIV